jgi:hypothetical protein
MNTKYSDLINQTYYFPQEEFTLNKDNLQFHNIDLMKLVEKYPTTSTKPKAGFVSRWKKTNTRPNTTIAIALKVLILNSL